MDDSVVLKAERRKRPSNRDALIVFALAFGPPTKLPTAHSSLGGRLISPPPTRPTLELLHRSVTSTYVLHYDG